MLLWHDYDLALYVNDFTGKAADGWKKNEFYVMIPMQIKHLHLIEDCLQKGQQGCLKM